MIRISKLMGLAVVSSETGKRIGLADRVILSADGQDAEGLVLRPWGFGRAKRFVSLDSIVLWGEVSIAVHAIQKISTAQKMRSDIIGLAVLDTSGQRLGWVTDVLIDEESGRVLSLEISRGIVDDFTTGRICVHNFTMRPGGVVAVTETPEEDNSSSVFSR